MKRSGIFLDVDGTMIDSLPAKGRAFAKALGASGYAHRRVLRIHNELAGTHRAEKLRAMFSAMHGRDPSPFELEDLVESFANALLDELLECPLTTGLVAFLSNCQERQQLVFAVSAMPKRELDLVVDHHKLSGLLTEWTGYPALKGDSIQRILSSGVVEPASTVVVGDSVEDQRVAHAAGLRFVQMVLKGASPLPSQDGHVFDFVALEELLNARDPQR